MAYSRKDNNSTDYEHPNEENLLNLHKSMDYTEDGKPAIRVLSNIQGDIVIEGNVSIPGEVSIVQPVAITDNDGSITVDGTVSVDNFPETQPVSGTVTIQDGGGSITVDGEVSVIGAGAFPSEVIGTDPYGAAVIRIDDTTKQHTSKNRVKVSGFEVTDYASFTNGKDEGIWDEVLTGTASSTWDQYKSMIELKVGSSVGDKVVRQTKRVQQYVPGRQNEVSMSMIFGEPTIGVRRRFGIFDDVNGAFFEDGGDGTYYVVIRRNSATGVIETRVAREDWNVDRLDGMGPSGILANPYAIQLMVIEYEWYGAGMVEFKFVINNNAYPIHEFVNGNIATEPWSSTSFLPVRVELENYGAAPGTHEFYQGSHSFLAEGKTSALGRQSSISTPVTGYSLGPADIFRPVVSIRLKSDQLDSVVIPDAYSGATLDNTNIFIRVIENAEITGGAWVSFSDDSSVEYNLTATGFVGGKVVETVFVSAGNMGQIYSFPERVITQLQRTTTTTIGDTSGTFTIAIAAINANKAGWGILGWIEVR
jgi:hypothetical protein